MLRTSDIDRVAAVGGFFNRPTGRYNLPQADITRASRGFNPPKADITARNKRAILLLTIGCRSSRLYPLFARAGDIAPAGAVISVLRTGYIDRVAAIGGETAT